MIRNILLWLRIIRPQTLFASLVPVLVAGVIVSETAYTINSITLCVTAFCALSLQILSNLINDYYDYLRGTDKAGRKGFKRALAEGEVTPKAMLCACLLAAAVACLLGLYLVYTGGVVILVIGLTALLFAWLYTATPYSLSYLGIADIFVFLYYGVIACSGTAYLLLCGEEHTDGWNATILSSVYAGAVSGCISMCVLMINNLRDTVSDRAVGKRTFPVRFGKNAAHIFLFIVVLLMPLFAYLAFRSPLPMLVVIPAFVLWMKIIRSEGAAYNKCLVFAGMINLIYLILCCL